MRKRKRLLLLLGILSLTVVLAACGTDPISAESTGFWDRYIVYNFSRIIIWLSNFLGGNYGVGIIAFTLLVRIILLPVTYYQTKSSRKMTDVQPQLKELQEKYSSKDTETKEKLREETSKLYEEAGVNPAAGCLPLLIQMPVLIALYQSISRTEVLRTGHFLWVNLGTPDPLFIMPILAALLTLATSKLTSMSQLQKNSSMAIMTYMMPVMILFITISLPSALGLYFVISNGFSVAQTLLLNNPFKIRKEREEKIRAEKERERARQQAIRQARKSGRSVSKKK
ncbi:YidC/Oxa1 family membrane protein insertase [Pisciglobus halotolerans]|uniref:Membrane protein insertase YidC n=1 Tax=Pisciglobus halotolerans TaxID=745365 RepID=A0A1I3DTM9_9LACT|nr:YidC/Oxa1 family membrane protein insertase [Pisciglobus halotolerans]SFH89958.1 YidC/Oxa1 family membrane protein insertase [Pisciglobus halotolerans]